jgi:RNA polymerase sigma-70 factor (ECF subfamily)
MPALSERFEEIYKTHYKALRNAAENIIGDGDAAHDIVQEVFLKLWNRKDELGAILNERAYLYKAVINSSITHLSNSKKKSSLSDAAIGSSGSADTEMMTKELRGKIQLALDALPPKCKAIFVLSRFEGMKNKEIAQVLNLSLKTVENQMGIALKKMRDDLKPYMNNEFFSWFFLLGISLLHNLP